MNKNYTTYNFTVPVLNSIWSLSILINGGASGVSKEDEIHVNDFIEAVLKDFGEGHWGYDPNEEPQFRYDNDIHDLGDNCLNVKYTVFED